MKERRIDEGGYMNSELYAPPYKRAYLWIALDESINNARKLLH
jgi:hypothetical protein